MGFIVGFPSVYDQYLGRSCSNHPKRSLGKSISCTSTAGLISTVQCLASNRKIFVGNFSNFQKYIPSASSPISLRISGIINPNYNINSNTGYIKLNVITQNSDDYLDINELVTVLEPKPAPAWCPINTITASNYFARLKTDYNLNFTLFSKLPSQLALGKLIILFPPQYDMNTQNLSCSSTTLFSSSPFCNISSSLITVVGNLQDFNGDLSITLNNIKNPEDITPTKAFFLQTYDGYNLKILERSFENLDPFYFSFSFLGPTFTINNGLDILAQVGSQTSTIYIVLQFQCALNLTFKPFTSGFSVVPNSLNINVSQIQTSFRVSVPKTVSPGTYYIQWETLNDFSPPMYTPLRKTKVVISASKGISFPLLCFLYILFTDQNLIFFKVMVHAGKPYDIPKGGSSLFIYLFLDNPPDSQLILNLNFSSNDSSISMNSKSFTFEGGSSLQYLQV